MGKGSLLQYASKDLKADREIVLAAVKNRGSLLRNAPKELKNDREIVLAALMNTGNALEFASEEWADQVCALVRGHSSGDFVERVEKVARWLSSLVPIQVLSVERVSDQYLSVNVSTMGGIIHPISVQANDTTEALRVPLAACLAKGEPDDKPFYSFSFVLPNRTTCTYGDDRSLLQ